MAGQEFRDSQAAMRLSGHGRRPAPVRVPRMWHTILGMDASTRHRADRDDRPGESGPVVTRHAVRIAAVQRLRRQLLRRLQRHPGAARRWSLAVVPAGHGLPARFRERQPSIRPVGAGRVGPQHASRQLWRCCSSAPGSPDLDSQRPTNIIQPGPAHRLKADPGRLGQHVRPA